MGIDGAVGVLHLRRDAVTLLSSVTFLYVICISVTSNLG